VTVEQEQPVPGSRLFCRHVPILWSGRAVVAPSATPGARRAAVDGAWDP
jgi:hypothetical protein